MQSAPPMEPRFAEYKPAHTKALQGLELDTPLSLKLPPMPVSVVAAARESLQSTLPVQPRFAEDELVHTRALRGVELDTTLSPKLPPMPSFAEDEPAQTRVLQGAELGTPRLPPMPTSVVAAPWESLQSTLPVVPSFAEGELAHTRALQGAELSTPLSPKLPPMPASAMAFPYSPKRPPMSSPAMAMALPPVPGAAGVAGAAAVDICMSSLAVGLAESDAALESGHSIDALSGKLKMRRYAHSMSFDDIEAPMANEDGRAWVRDPNFDLALSISAGPCSR